MHRPGSLPAPAALTLARPCAARRGDGASANGSPGCAFRGKANDWRASAAPAHLPGSYNKAMMLTEAARS